MIVRTTNDLPELNKIASNSIIQVDQKSGTSDNDFSSMKVKYSQLSGQISDESFNEKFKSASENDESKTTISKNLVIESTLSVTNRNNTDIDKNLKIEDYTNSRKPVYWRVASQSFVANYINEAIEPIIVPEILKNSVAVSSEDFVNDISVKYTDGSNSSFLNMSNSEDGSLREIKIDPFTRRGYTEDFICNKTGMLVVYGWCADYGTIEPQQCWIALGGYDITTSKYGILKLEPWIQGQNHTTLQYFGFSIPVQEDLRVRVETGFEPNLYISGMQGGRTSLVGGLNGAGNGGSAIFYII